MGHFFTWNFPLFSNPQSKIGVLIHEKGLASIWTWKLTSRSLDAFMKGFPDEINTSLVTKNPIDISEAFENSSYIEERLRQTERIRLSLLSYHIVRQNACSDVDRMKLSTLRQELITDLKKSIPFTGITNHPFTTIGTINLDSENLSRIQCRRR